jgi:myo-inositol-1(or 4)-monophosphatase
VAAPDEIGGAAAAPWLWVVDPLDGTKNYAHGYPRSCVSIAVMRSGVAVVGVVYNPRTAELFAAETGAGARCNDVPIRVSGTARIGRAMVASALTYAPGAVRLADRGQLERLARVLAAAEALRSDGCCALDLCDVARGRFDAYFERGLKAWDTAAGALIVREAGGKTSTFDGAPHDPFGMDTLATNGIMHTELVALMAP